MFRTVIVVIAVCFVGAASIPVFNQPSLLSMLTNGANKANADINKKQSADDSTAEIASNQQARSEEPTGEEHIDIDKEGVGKITKPTSRCRGVGCPTANPPFSIIIDKHITVRAGTTVGPFTMRTSNGMPANLSGPYGLERYTPYSFGYSTDFSAKPSLQYYIRAELDTAVKTHTLYVSANHPPTESIVKTTIQVTVLPAETTTSNNYPGPSYSPSPAPSTTPPDPTMSPSP